MRNNKIKLIQGDTGLYEILYKFEEKDFAKTVEAFEIAGCGCMVQTTIETKTSIDINSIFVAGCRINRVENIEGNICECTLVKDAR